jgi:hypothetical protein
VKVVIDIEPGKDPEGLKAALRTMMKQVADDKRADPDLDACLELADPVGRALRAEIVGVVDEQYGALVPYIAPPLEGS